MKDVCERIAATDPSRPAYRAITCYSSVQIRKLRNDVRFYEIVLTFKVRFPLRDRERELRIKTASRWFALDDFTLRPQDL